MVAWQVLGRTFPNTQSTSGIGLPSVSRLTVSAFYSRFQRLLGATCVKEKSEHADTDGSGAAMKGAVEDVEAANFDTEVLGPASPGTSF